MVEQVLVLKEEADFSAGNFERTEWKNGRLMLVSSENEDTVRGSYTSPEYRAVAFEELAVCWNASIPAGCSLEAFARVRISEQWSHWFSYGKWSVFSSRSSLSGQDAGRVRMENGVLVIDAPGGADQFQIRVELTAQPGAEVPTVSLLAAGIRAQKVSLDVGDAVQHRVLPSPAYSLHTRDPRLEPMLAGPCTLAMLANRWGADVLPEEAAYACYDSVLGNCSNPCFAAAFLGCYGLESYVMYLDCAGLKKEIKNGCLCAAWMNFSPQEGGSRAVVVRGFETDQDGAEYVFVNDPGWADDASTEQRWPLERLRQFWDRMVLVVHGRLDNCDVCAPARYAGELRPTQIPGEYALFIRGERHSIPTDLCTRNGRCTATVCYTVRDEHAYATTAQKRFYYTNVTSSGHIWLDTSLMPAGTRLTAYLITDRGNMVTAGLTVEARNDL